MDLIQVSVLAFWVAMGLYVAASVLHVSYFLEKRHSLAWYARFLTGAGFIAQTIAIGVRSTATHGTQLNGPNSLVLASWALVLVYFAVEHFTKQKVYGVVLVPFATAAVMLAQLLGANSAAAGVTSTELKSVLDWVIGIHVGLVVFSNAGFAIAAASSLVYLLQESALKSHKKNAWVRRMPSLAAADHLARRAVSWAVPAFAAGLAMGVLRAVELSHTSPGVYGAWYFDPRIMLAGVTLVYFALYLYLRAKTTMTSRSAAWMCLAGMALVATNAVLARAVPAGFHIFAQKY